MRWCVLLLLLVGSVSFADTYRWVDENGVVNYSDQPHPGAERIQLDEVQTFSAPVWTQEPPSRPATGDVPANTTDDAPRHVVTIMRPQPEETLWNIEGTLDVVVDIQPRIRRGSNMRLYLDGQQVTGVSGGSGTVVINRVYRGAHTLRATVEDRSGNVIASSDTVPFFVQQTTVNQNPQTRPPRPTPRPRAGG